MFCFAFQIGKCFLLFLYAIQVVYYSILETHDIYVVVKLSKVLSGDPDKSLMPYISPDKKSFMGSSSPETFAWQCNSRL